MHNSNPDDRAMVSALAGAAGLSLARDRVEILQPAFRRLRTTARWIAQHDLGYTEPAAVFDARVNRSEA